MKYGTFLANDIVTHNSGGGGTTCCFPTGTQILMADGTTKSIEFIGVNDRVLSYDLENGCCIVSNVVKPIVKIREGVYDINDGLVSPTDDHPLYVRKPDGTLGWAAINPEKSKVMYDNRNAMYLDIGDELLNADGKWIKVCSIEYLDEDIKTYTFTVDSSFHNYFANRLLVSNAQDCEDPVVPDNPSVPQEQEQQEVVML